MKTLIVVSSQEACDQLKQTTKSNPNFDIVRTIEECQEAIEKSSSHPYDLVLTDLYWKTSKLNSKQKVKYKSLSYDPKVNEFYFERKQLHLTKKSKDLLGIFLKNPEKLLSTNFIKERYWGDHEPSTTSRNLRSNIQILRTSLKKVNCNDWIITIRGEGYLLKSNKVIT